MLDFFLECQCLHGVIFEKHVPHIWIIWMFRNIVWSRGKFTNVTFHESPNTSPGKKIHLTDARNMKNSHIIWSIHHWFPNMGNSPQSGNPEIRQFAFTKLPFGLSSCDIVWIWGRHHPFLKQATPINTPCWHFFTSRYFLQLIPCAFCTVHFFGNPFAPEMQRWSNSDGVRRM